MHGKYNSSCLSLLSLLLWGSLSSSPSLKLFVGRKSHGKQDTGIQLYNKLLLWWVAHLSTLSTFLSRPHLQSPQLRGKSNLLSMHCPRQLIQSFFTWIHHCLSTSFPTLCIIYSQMPSSQQELLKWSNIASQFLGSPFIPRFEIRLLRTSWGFQVKIWTAVMKPCYR